MTFFVHILSLLGQHYILVIIGCIEILLAAFLICKSVKYSIKPPLATPKSVVTGDDRLIQEWIRKKKMVVIVTRVRDRLPLTAYGELKELLGISLEELQQDVMAINHRIADEQIAKQLEKKVGQWDGQTLFEDEFFTRDKRWIKINIIRSEDDVYEISSMEDITKYHNVVDEFAVKVKEIEAESNSKTTFLSRMSHEIRTPMNGIIGMLTLARGKVEPDHPVMQYFDKAGELCDHLLSLINDILDMSRIEAGKVELEEKPFSIKSLGDKLYDMFAKNLQSRGISYEILYENMSVDWVMGDELRISQIIINFLSNAVKFTSQGEITVTFRQMMVKEGVADIMVCVHDTGIGMSSEFINRIFNPFEQESIETSKNYGGTGLGMAITDQLVTLMGGEIVVESQPNQGSNFFVFFHWPIVEEKVEPEQEKDSADGDADITENVFNGRRILLAEDNELNAMIAVEILQGMGAMVEVAENGQQAVDKFARQEPGYFDVILMDVQMPVLNGREATRKIRALDRADASQILIYGLSADAFVEDKRLSVESGMNGHFAKPVDFEQLRKSIAPALLKGEK